jgi:hypothetical protein
MVHELEEKDAIASADHAKDELAEGCCKHNHPAMLPIHGGQGTLTYHAHCKKNNALCNGKLRFSI